MNGTERMDLPAATVTLGAKAAARQGFWSLTRKSINAHGLHLAVLAFYYAGFILMLRLRPDMETASFVVLAVGFLIFSVPIMLIGLLFTRFYHIARFVQPERPLPALYNDMKAYLGNSARMAHGLPMVFIMVLFMYVFVQFKANIPVLAPYAWDETFMKWDAALHFGYQPWEWLQPVLGYAPVTFLINLNYNGWFAVMWIVWVYFAFADQASETRTRFFLTFFVAWIIGGSAMAIYFSSVGPSFYGLIGLSPNPFAAQMEYLRAANDAIPIWAVSVQDMLWAGYKEGGAVEGISAMPSMHNGTALLFALAGYKVSRTMGRILLAHAALIFIGSVHLAWHYAVDSYVAWALVLVLWWALGYVSRWWHATAAQRDFEAALARAA